MQMYDEGGQVCLFDLDSCAGKMCREPSPAAHRKAKTSASSSRRSSESKIAPVQCLDLTPGHGDLLGQPYWEWNSHWLGDVWTLNTGVSPKDAKDCSLWQILLAEVPPGYYLSRRACLGILRRADERGKQLPGQLEWALLVQAGIVPFHGGYLPEAKAYHINQRDEGIDLNGVAGALMATSNIQMQTFVAGFSAGAGANAGSVGYSEEVSPTLKGSASGNCMPSVLCLNDQGGEVMDCAENISGTLRAQEHGHQPLVFENHGIDSRYTGPHTVAPTMSARYGTGGNNVPLVAQEIPEVYCITGNAIDRQPENGGNGIGYQEDIAYTLTATDHHAVFSRQRVDGFRENDVVSTESARQHKDATDLIVQIQQPESNAPVVLLIRRLVPLECERLQGFPDGWTDIPGASDSVRYKALGNSVAIPCVEYILHGMKLVLEGP